MLPLVFAQVARVREHPPFKIEELNNLRFAGPAPQHDALAVTQRGSSCGKGSRLLGATVSRVLWTKGGVTQAGRIQASTSDQAGPPAQGTLRLPGRFNRDASPATELPIHSIRGQKAIRLMRRDRHVAARDPSLARAVVGAN
jgi:hypothetical protein